MPAHLLQYSDLEGLYDDPVRAGRFAGLVEELRTPDTVVVGTGDNVAPSVLSIVTGGEQALALFDHVGPDADTFGNHDFDVGMDALRTVVRESPQTWLNSNLRLDGVPFASDEGAVPHAVVESGGARVGLVGVTTPNAPGMNPESAALSVADPVETVEEFAATLRTERGADEIVVLSHLGDDELVGALDTEIDAVLDGHNHDPTMEVVDGTPLARPGADGERIVELVLGDDPDLECHAVDDAPVVAEVRDALRGLIERAGLDETVATVESPVSLSREAGARGESRIGNFVTDAYRWAAGADVAVLAARAIRDGDELAGDVTPFDLVEVVPFDDPLVVLELPGRRLRETFRELNHRRRTIRDWYFGHVSGAELAWDADGSLRDVRVGGEDVRDGGTYSLATTAYFVETDHIFSAFDASHVIEYGEPQYRALVEFAREEGVEPAVEGRIIRPDERPSGDVDAD